MFSDRTSAGVELARLLEKYRQQANTVVLAVPRGGVPVGVAVAREMGLPLDLVLTKKIGHPTNREYAIGAATLTNRLLVPHADVDPDYIEAETGRVRERLREMERLFRPGKPPLNVKGATVIIVDDGIATGNTLLATLQLLRKQQPARLVVAVPVAPEGAADRFKEAADEFVCAYTPPYFTGVGAFYEQFHQVSDEEVVELLGEE